MAYSNNDFSRREFIKKSALTMASLPLLTSLSTGLGSFENASMPKIHIFSKHLQFLDYNDMAEAAAEIGFEGVDLTVRPKGHVLPENVETDLPKAVESLKKYGFSPLLMTTAIDDAGDDLDRRVLDTAAGLGIEYYRMNWYRYLQDKTLPESLEMYKHKVKKLSRLNKKLGIIGCYQNHSGKLVGASLWEVWEMLQGANENMGAQYDIRHALVEGGLSWENGFKLIQSSIKTIVLKDYLWEKKNGKWQVKNTPMGEGMVDFKAYFKLLKQHNINVPVSMHLEYDLGGAQHGAGKLSVKPEVVFKAMEKDLRKAKELWQEA